MNPNIASADSRTSHPDLYTAPVRPAAEDEVAALLETLVYLLKPDFALETGTAYGHTASRIAKALARNGVGHLDTCEQGPNRIPHAVRALEGLPATVHKCPYQDFVPPDGRQYQLAFFDATRKKRDIEFLHFQKWLPAGALILFHDCGAQHPGGEGVDKLEAAGLIKSLYLPTPRGARLAQVL